MARDQDILLGYEQLSYFEREEVVRWLKKHFREIPLSNQVKHAGLEGLSSGNLSMGPTLAVLRYAMNALCIYQKP